MPAKQILIPEYMVPDFCPKCTAPIINKRRARIVNPKRRKRVPFCCAQSNFLGLGSCPYESWVSLSPVAVGIVLWRDPRTLIWYVLVAECGIGPYLGRETLVMEHVMPGYTSAQTCVHALQRGVGIPSVAANWYEMEEIVDPRDPMLLFTFHARVMLNKRMPKLRPDGRAIRTARWVPKEELLAELLSDKDSGLMRIRVRRAVALMDSRPSPPPTP